jgi:hypothetical protein
MGRKPNVTGGVALTRSDLFFFSWLRPNFKGMYLGFQKELCEVTHTIGKVFLRSFLLFY